MGRAVDRSDRAGIRRVMEKTATPAAPKTAAPFKSDRAAKLAFRKAEKAYYAARDAYNAVLHKSRETGWDDEKFETLRKADEAMKAAADHAEAVYKKVLREGFWVKSWEFGNNPTRDLIAANMD